MAVLEAVSEMEESDESPSKIQGAVASEEVAEVEGEPAETEGTVTRTTMGMGMGMGMGIPIQHISQHLPYLHLPVLAVEAALVVA